jgi:DNA mismatch endonuclease (patch repair protein)
VAANPRLRRSIERCLDVDLISPERRSENMRAIKGKDTAPEIAVRKVLHQMGLRFRLHRKDLPGRPDIVLPRLRLVILVHGCFWHGHHCKKGSGRRRPKTNQSYWNPKLDRNIARDHQNANRLSELGWKSVVIWECETANAQSIAERLRYLCFQINVEIERNRQQARQQLTSNRRVLRIDEK